MGFRLKVNGEEVWESEFDASTVTNVSVRTAAGEATAVGSPSGHDWVDIVFTTLSPGEELRFHSNAEQQKRQELADKIDELEGDRVEEGRAQMAEEEKKREEEAAEVEGADVEPDENASVAGTDSPEYQDGPTNDPAYDENQDKEELSL